MSAPTSNSWLRGQRKSDLVEVAENVGLTKYVCHFISSRRGATGPSCLLLPISFHPAHLPHPRNAQKTNDLSSFESLKKVDLEAALDRFLTQNATTFSSDPKLAGYFQSQAKARGSPVKRESTDDAAKPLRVAKRRTTRAPEDLE